MLGCAGPIRGQGRGGLVGGVDGGSVFYIKLDVVIVVTECVAVVVVFLVLLVQGGRGRRQRAQDRVAPPVGAG